MDLNITSKNDTLPELVHIVLGTDLYFVSFVGNHIEIIITQFQILPATANIQVLYEFICPDNQRSMLYHYLHI